MSEVIRFEEISKEEQIYILVHRFSKHERKDEIASILSTFTSYNIKSEDCLKYYEGLVTEEIEQKLCDSIVGYSDNGSEQKAWSTILNTLGYKTVCKIMDKWDIHVGKYIAIESQLADIRKLLYKDFLPVKEERELKKW